MATKLDSKTSEFVTELIRNGEYGVGLEWLAEAVSKQRLNPSASQSKEIERLAKLMEIDLNFY